MKFKQKHLVTKCKIRAYVYRVVMFTLLPMVMPAVAFAAEEKEKTEAESAGLTSIISGLQGLKTGFITVVGIIGGIIFVWQCIEIGNGVKSGDSAQMSGGIKGAIGGGIMCAAGILLNIFAPGS